MGADLHVDSLNLLCQPDTSLTFLDWYSSRNTQIQILLKTLIVNAHSSRWLSSSTNKPGGNGFEFINTYQFDIFKILKVKLALECDVRWAEFVLIFELWTHIQFFQKEQRAGPVSRGFPWMLTWSPGCLLGHLLISSFFSWCWGWNPRPSTYRRVLYH